MLVLRISEMFGNMSAAYEWAAKQTQCVDKGSSLYLTWSDKPKGWAVYRSEIPTDWTNKNIVDGANKHDPKMSIIEAWGLAGDAEALSTKHVTLKNAREMLASGINTRYPERYKEKI